ncbi:poly(A) polymerase/tRNA nucleotidyltransferase family protein [Crocosphaera subtropica ATCC 51142]|uniref:Poly(A) polymerase/tRNA nucleotidyltransferase family protein n=1 Tax=Crocosphaera subtropica (strain ATCC 51142 / BH68) TaxID=43989 RepID=B1WYW6_CROS5|nr:CCA tRNA nucleotidyltransferase [Crocosphaera subtropica]ACB52730.1 poly(A) polymerase/tRNA nucleotidyltransferase family protein [Crocosphaera subtropica ATCC 51142]
MSQPTLFFNLSSKILPFDLELLPMPAYLVGGMVRDSLLNYQQNYLDLDFVLPELVIETAKKISNQYNAGFVVLDAERKIARVVFEQGTVDFAQQEGDTIETDLRRRDFTINAIAYNFHQQQVIDPLNGLEDLQTKTIRMIHVKNLQDDPLRLFRAYRQAAQLKFKIDPKTRQTIVQLSSLITQVATERVQTELNYLLGNSRGSYWLSEMEKDGLLKIHFPHINHDNLQLLKEIDRVLELLLNKLKETEFKSFFNLQDNQEIYKSSLIQRARLTCLVSNNTEIAKRELMNLKYSNQDIKAILNILSHLPWLRGNQQNISFKNLYFLFLELGDNFPIFALVALAKKVNNQLIFKLIDHYLNPQDKVAHPIALITGHDLIKNLNMKPSPQLGQLLTEVSIAQVEGKISTKEEALNFARHSLKNWS